MRDYQCPFKQAGLDKDALYDGIEGESFLVDWRQSMDDDWHSSGTLEHLGDLAVTPTGQKFFLVWDDETQGQPLFLVPINPNYIRNTMYKGKPDEETVVDLVREITDAFDSIEVPTCGAMGPCVLKYDNWLRMEDALSKLCKCLGLESEE